MRVLFNITKSFLPKSFPLVSFSKLIEETDDDDNDSAVVFDEDQLVAQAHPSEVFEEKRQHTSTTSITSSDIEDFNLPAEYYGEGAQEYQIEDWESHRGLEHVSYNHSSRIHQQASSHRRSSQRRASSRVVGRKKAQKQQQYYHFQSGS